MRSTFIEIFKKNETNQEYDALKIIADHLLAKGGPANIVETGAGQMTTEIWDYISERTGGFAAIVDHCEPVIESLSKKCKHAKLVTQDSIYFLRNFWNPEAVDLLYLDSKNSDLHAIGELSCVYDSLKPGCLIAVNSNYSLINKFFNKLSVYPMFRSKITIWQKPEA